MSNKKAKRKMEEDADKSGIVIAILMAFAIIIGLYIIGSYIRSGFSLLHNALPQTVYFPSNQFPITVYGAYMNGTKGIGVEYFFFGTPQSNGKECISSVAVYPINPTNMSISSTTPLINTTNPEKVVEIYNYSRVYLYFEPYTSYGHTLLCPNIVNATK